MTNADYLETFKNLLGMESVLKGQIHDHDMVDIVTEEKYQGESYEIINPQKKEFIQQSAKEQYLTCAFICHIERKIYSRLIEELENDYTRGGINHPEYMVQAYQLLN